MPIDWTNKKIGALRIIKKGKNRAPSGAFMWIARCGLCSGKAVGSPAVWTMEHGKTRSDKRPNCGCKSYQDLLVDHKLKVKNNAKD